MYIVYHIFIFDILIVRNFHFLIFRKTDYRYLQMRHLSCFLTGERKSCQAGQSKKIFEHD